ncbi:hypothetical protein GLAREA_09165 [Glarea lozoyensis ATCC 20868]|uniref:Uncharacterized protein n=1 Tax=Glarea lozoyensis (strain ATCC 20868 / MF5171) TaxID=1116229 RepID=S3DF11_GLAL2|nr:uncharacterized protein GLAREA_09165 [Glarea lozoyensis ATCC 20868]EPE37002.1 hypothetical protein GLAREA_09165 [Glarea lozoyensis ATCC 20868]
MEPVIESVKGIDSSPSNPPPAHKDVDRLEESHSPLQSSTHVTPRKWSTPKPQDPEIAAWYGVTPIDGTDTTATSQTQKALQLLFGDEQVRPHVGDDGKVSYWQCGLKASQVRDAFKTPGVKSVWNTPKKRRN